MYARKKIGLADRYAKLVLVLVVTLGLFILLLLMLAGSISGIPAQPGFLGTRAFLYSDLNLIAQFALLMGLSLGVVLARRGHYKAHQYTQTTMVLFNLVLVLSIMVGSFSRHVVPGLPGNLSTLYGIIPTIHASVGALAVGCGVYLLLRMNQLLPKGLRIKGWKNLMRLTFGLYWTVGLLGLAVYYVWYVL
jgi:uncharacterized membrane protein YozB (DUF420 family)